MAQEAADVIIRDADVLTVDSRFSKAQAVAIRGDRIVLVGTNRQVEALARPNTRVIEGKGKTVLPGLYDSHVHSFRASLSEFGGPAPVLASLEAAFEFIRKKAASQPPGDWIILERVYPTRMKEGRLPTKA